MTQTFDGILDTVLAKSRNMLVPWFLMASYTYYCRDHSLLTDARFDRLTKELLEELPHLTHRHLDLIDPQALQAGSGYHLAETDYPLMVIGAACHLARIPRPDLTLSLAPPVRQPKVKFVIKKKNPVKLVFGRK